MTSLLPQSINSLRTRVFENLSKRLDQIPTDKVIVRDYDKVDARALPILIEELKLNDFITDTMSEDMIRKLLKIANQLHAIKGTNKAVKLALETVGIVGVITEWWQTNPEGNAGTFKVEALVNENLVPIKQPVFTEDRVKEAYRLIDASKRKSAHYQIIAGSQHQAAISFASAFVCQQRLNAIGSFRSIENV